MHYPAIRADRVALSEAIYGLANDSEERARYLKDPGAYAMRLELTAEERSALVNMEEAEMRSLGVHPFLPFMARLQLDRQRKGPA